MRCGDHLHKVIRECTGEDFEPDCECDKYIRRMNRYGVAWARKHFAVIVEKLRREATRRRWWRLLARLPGVRFPLRAMVREAIRRSETNGHGCSTTENVF